MSSALTMPGCNALSNASSICSTRALNQSAQHRPRRRRGAACSAATRRPCARSTDRSRSSRVDGITVRMARSMDRPMRYFLAKRHEGPALLRRRSHRHAAARARRRRPGRAVSSELHPHGAGPLRRRARARRLSRSGSRPTRASSRRRAARCPPDLDEIGRRYIGALADEIAKWLTAIDRSAIATGADRRRFSGGIDSGSVFLVDLSHDAAARPVAGAAQGVRAESRRRTRRRAGARVSRRRRPVAVPRGDRRDAPDDLDVERDAARARGLQAARRRVRGDGPAAVPRASASAIRTGGIWPTATAATRTSRTIRSRRTRSSRSAASSTT